MTRFASLAAAGALTLAVAASVPAWADDAPVRGSAECTVLVNADTAVKAAADALDAANGLLSLLPATATLEDRVQATKEVTDADAALLKARADAALELCVDLPTDTDDPGTGDPGTDDPGDTGSETPSDPVDDTPTVPVFTDDRDCSDFDSQEAAQTYFLAYRTAAQPDPDRLDANNNGIACEGAFDEGGSTTVDPLADDGSTANVSGNQVTVVPEGSAQTGSL